MCPLVTIISVLDNIPRSLEKDGGKPISFKKKKSVFELMSLSEWNFDAYFITSSFTIFLKS